MTVEEKDKGTMPKVEGQATVAPPADGKTPEVLSKVSSETPQMVPQKEVDDQLHSLRSEMGRENKSALDTIIKERDSLKSQLGTADTQTQGYKSEIDTLNRQVSDLTSDDPKRFDIVTRDKDLRERDREHNTNVQTLEVDKKAHAEEVKVDHETAREVISWKIAAEYDGGDAIKLKGLCERSNASSEEQIREVADILWAKKQTETPGVIPYSGQTDGGQGFFTREQINDRGFWETHREAILEAQAAGRIK